MGTKRMGTKCEINCGDEVSLRVFKTLSPYTSSDTLSRRLVASMIAECSMEKHTQISGAIQLC